MNKIKKLSKDLLIKLSLEELKELDDDLDSYWSQVRTIIRFKRVFPEVEK